jgi:hypothetical protein
MHLCCQGILEPILHFPCAQAPLDSPLQPGATFGGVIDLRPQQQLPHGSRQQHVPAALQCHQLVVMLETEEVGGAGLLQTVVLRTHSFHPVV